MIIEYQRPKTIDEALSLLARDTPLSFPLGGGTVLNQGMDLDFAVIDLQALDLGKISIRGNMIHVGAMVTQQQLLDANGLPAELFKVIELESTYNIRQMATIAGTLVTATGRSHLATALLAVDAVIETHAARNNPKKVKLGDWLPLRKAGEKTELITDVSIPANVQLAYEYIARTPADLPIVSSAVARWNSGRTRVVLGGWGDSPVLAMDGPSSDGMADAARNAYNLAGDQWGSAEYRQEMAGILSLRCMERIDSTSKE